MTQKRMWIIRVASIIALVVYGVVLCVYSVVPAGTPGTGVVQWLPGGDLGAHALAYLVLTALLAATLVTTRLPRPVQLALGVGVALAVNVSLELTQEALPHRSMSLKDVLAGLAGTLVVCVVWLLLAGLLSLGERSNRTNASPGPVPAPHREENQ
jgi:VanZ family protein